MYKHNPKHLQTVRHRKKTDGMGRQTEMWDGDLSETENMLWASGHLERIA